MSGGPNFLAVLNIFLVLNYFWLIDSSELTCTTPDGSISKCVPTIECSSMVTALTTAKRPLSEAGKNQLRSYICDENETMYSVCCPLTPIILSGDESNAKQGFESTPIFKTSLHKNSNLLPSDCGFVDLTDKVVGGTNASLTEFPWMALLGYRDSDKAGLFKCGGTIINERYILTAAHCFEEASKLIAVRLGEYDKDSVSDCFKGSCNDRIQDVTIEEIIRHPNFNRSTFENDIGLLRVTPIYFNEKNVRPICLPINKEPVPNDQKVLISGWGLTNRFGSTSRILQKAYLPVVNQSECRKIYQNTKNILIDERLICAGGGKNDSYACLGDSGGPIQVLERFVGEENTDFRYVQYGVVSFGNKTCSVPSTFTKVNFFMEWILDNIKP